MSNITPRRQVFVDEYCRNGLNATQAYKTAYPNCKGGHNRLGARLMTRDVIKQAIAVKLAEKHEEREHNYAIACDMLRQRIAWLDTKAELGDTQAIQAQTALIRELNCITGLQKHELKQTGPEIPQLADAERQALADLARDYKLRLARPDQKAIG